MIKQQFKDVGNMDIKKKKIVAVILTHNRKNLLLEGLKSIFNQTYSIYKIIIVDNKSSDGTHEKLKNKGILNRSDVEYIRLDQNKGPSGGFAEGINYAIKENPDWVWILDDDISPRPECLEFLMEYGEISSCIAPYREGKTVPIFNPAIGITSHSKSLSFDGGKEYIFSNTCCFEGMLLHSNLIKKIGLPDERFFQVYGDTIYGFVSSIYTNIVHVKKASIIRLLPEKKPITNKRVYLSVRNMFLVREYLKKYNLLRPGLFTITFISIVLHYSILMTIKTRSIGMPFAVFKGIVHGIRGKFVAPK